MNSTTVTLTTVGVCNHADVTFAQLHEWWGAGIIPNAPEFDRRHTLVADWSADAARVVRVLGNMMRSTQYHSGGGADTEALKAAAAIAAEHAEGYAVLIGDAWRHVSTEEFAAVLVSADGHARAVYLTGADVEVPA